MDLVSPKAGTHFRPHSLEIVGLEPPPKAGTHFHPHSLKIGGLGPPPKAGTQHTHSLEIGLALQCQQQVYLYSEES
jgi:hypothetical protein